MKIFGRAYLLVCLILQMFWSGFTANSSTNQPASFEIVRNHPLQQNYELEDWVPILTSAYEIAGLGETASVRSYNENGFIQGMASDGSNCIVVFAAHSPSSVYYEYIYREMKAQLTDTMFHEFSAKEGMANDINGELISQELIFTVDDYRIIAGFSCTPPYSKSWDDVYYYAEFLYNALNAGSTVASPTPEEEDLCNGVICPANSCNPDGTTLVHDCACNSSDGKCDCLETTCLGGCDPATNTCKQDLCANVSCPDKCENNTSFIAGTCNPTTGDCDYSQVVDCGDSVCDPNTFLCLSPSDLAVRDILLVQAIEGGILVSHKPTAAVVSLSWPDPNLVAEIEVTLYVDGNPFQTIQKTQKATYTTSELNRNEDKAVFHLPTNYITSGEHLFTAETKLLNKQIIENDLTNNSKSISKYFVLTRPVTLLYAVQQSVSTQQLFSFHNKARTILLNVYPIPGVSMAQVISSIDENDYAKNQVLEMEELRNIYNSIPGQYARFAVGLYPDKKFGDGVYGFSYFWARRSVMVGDGHWNDHAHEALPHEMGHEFFGDEYYDNIFGTSPGISLPIEGYIYDGQRKILKKVGAFPGGLVNFMGNAGGIHNLWVSAETWNTLVEKYRIGPMSYLNNKYKLANIFAEQQESEGFFISGTITRSDLVSIRNLYHFEEMEIEPAVEDEYWINVIGQGGSAAKRYPLGVDFAEDSTEGYFTGNFPVDQNTIRALQILHHETVIWESQSSINTPQVTIIPPQSTSPLEGKIVINWQASDRDNQDLTFSILYSNDDGDSWTPLVTALKVNSVEVDFDRLPGGSDCLLRVIASDGWNTTIADTQQPFTVFDKPASLIIESPMEGSTYALGDGVELNAFVYDIDSPWVEGENIQWNSSLDGNLGSGSILLLDNLSSGTHTLTAVAITKNATNLQKSVTITIGEQQSVRNKNIIRTGIISEVLLVLLVAVIVLLVIFKRKKLQTLFILSIITLTGLLICFLISLIFFANSIRKPVDNASTIEETAIPVIDVPIQNTATAQTFVETEPVQETQNVNTIRNDFQGITMESPVGSGFTNEIVERTLGPDSFFGMAAHTHILIDSYPVFNSIFDAEIRVFDLEEYRNSDPDAEAIIEELQELLSHRPAEISSSLPFLPVQPCGLEGHAKVAYLDFSSGSGLRFLTQCVQNTWPINNDLLFYTFQGITSDNRYYVSAILPVSHSSLASYDQFEPDEDFDVTGLQLIANQFADLENLEDVSFNPSLADLDATIESITISR